MVLGRVVEHIVQIDLHAAGMCGVDQRLQVGFGAEGGIDRLVVEHVVAVVRAEGWIGESQMAETPSASR